MRNWHGRLWLALTLVLICVARVHGADRPLLQVGDQGAYVILLQHYLYRLEYLEKVPDGVFDEETKLALKRFQVSNGLEDHGTVDDATWKLLENPAPLARPLPYVVKPGESLWEIAHTHGVDTEALIALNDLEDPDLLRAGAEILVPARRETVADESSVALLHWDDVNRQFPTGDITLIKDPDTGTTLEVKRYHGHFHADVEPRTAEDTFRLKNIFSGKWSNNARAVLVKIGEWWVAASMVAFPRGEDSITDNQFPGHFCLYFLGSRDHLSGEIQLQHRANIMRIMGYGHR